MVILATINKAFNAFVKVLLTRNDPKEVLYVSPPGFDSKPIKGQKGLIMTTESNDSTVFVGVLYESNKTIEGERRLFATDANGKELGTVFLNKNGECVINAGTDYATKYNKLKADIAKFNLSLTSELALISGGIAAGGGAYTPTGIKIDIGDNTKAEKLRI